jgi:Concanavalin A-like lectin/glucanases superfamily
MPDREAGEVVSKAVSASGELTLSMDLTPFSTKPEADGVIASLGSSEGPGQMTMEQRGGALHVTIKAGNGNEARTVKLADIGETRIGQWVVTVQGGILRGYLNGKPVAEQPLGGSLADWNAKLLTFGSDGAGQRPWRGGLEGIAIYNRALTAQDVASQHAERSARWADRQPAPRVEVEAELIAASKPADPKVIAPYVRSLGENHYRVKKVVSGTLKDEEVIILQWAILGGKVLPSALREEGKVVRLSVEPVESHPELDGEHRSSDVFEPSLPVYYDIDS